ncbi:formate dehydorgenase-N alpha subunit, partial [Salmonella enterica subsp. enterica serovar Uganda str. R8-3404]
GTNPLHPNVVSNPAARLYEEDALRMGKKEQFPYVGTTYRLTEHFHTWTKHALLNAIAQPEQFVVNAIAQPEQNAGGSERYC